MVKKIKTMFVLCLILIITFSSSAHAEEFNFNYNEIFENHKLVRLIIDVETGVLIKVNDAAIDYYGYPSDEIVKMKITEINTLSPDETRKEWDAAAKEERNFFNFRHKLANGEIRDVEVHSYPFVHNDKQYLYSIIIDKTEAAALVKQIDQNRRIITNMILLIVGLLALWVIILFKNKEKYRRLSYYDQLTKVYSRHYLVDWEANRPINKDENSSYAVAVVLDINRFKHVNDTYGHLTGDRVLVEVAIILKASVRGNDLVVRYGGDEFLLILENTSEEKCQKIMERIKSQLLTQDKFDFPIEISYGIEELKGKPTIFDAIRVADEKMYEMKDGKVMNNHRD